MNIGGDFGFPLITIVEEFFFVVEKLLMCFGGKLKIGAFNDGIYGTRFLTKSAIDAFGHIYIVSGRSS